ncbi:MAG: zf-HC2 domain-containing protein [Treponema sp.]|nr:zf-HC2 domain-containing protein [Treponema sp.]
MSTCPEKDLLSVYIDGELPKVFKDDFEKHISSCDKCNSLLKKIQMTHDYLQKDNNSLTLSKSYVDASFERLQIKMRFANVTKKAKSKTSFNYTNIRLFAPAIAAAAVFALILPLRLFTAKKNLVQQNINSIATIQSNSSINQASLLKNRSVVSDLQSATLASFFDNSDENSSEQFQYVKNRPPKFVSIRAVSNEDFAPISKLINVENININDSKLQNLDIFKPEFSSTQNSITITLNPSLLTGR